MTTPTEVIAASATVPVLEVRGLSKKYGDFAAVTDVDFTVREGEIFGLLGKNGAGKSTTLSILAAQADPAAGEVRFRGQNILHARHQYRAEIGFVSQFVTLDRQLTVERLLHYHARYFGMRRQDAWAAAREALELVDLADRAARPVAVLSGGEAGRLMIARALLHRPGLVFLDEPSTGLDTQSRDGLWRLLRRLNEQGMSIVLTTHHLDDAASLCHRVAIMDRGRLLVVDEPQKIIASHAGQGSVEVDVSSMSEPAHAAIRAAFPGAAVDPSGTSLTVPTSEAQPTMARLNSLAGEFGFRLNQVVVRQPSLDSAYRVLTAEQKA